MKIFLFFLMIGLNLFNVGMSVYLSKNKLIVGEEYYYSFGWITGMITCAMIYLMYGV